LKGNVTVPRIATGATAYWLATDGVSEITESQPSIGQITLSPHAVGARVDYSLLLGRQFVGFDAMLRRELLRVIGAIVDVGVLNGSGNSGQPFGVLRTPGIGSASGTSINYATILGMLEDVRDANGTEAGIAWLMSQDVFTLLAARAKVTSGATIIDDGVTLAGKRVVVSQNVPDATLICADWSTILVGTWGVGPELAVDPFGAFRTLGATMRCLLSVDVAVTAPAAVVVASSVT
jgi:HK97 family phage major capsid protein